MRRTMVGARKDQKQDRRKKPHGSRCKIHLGELLESRWLLAGDLVAHWRADDLASHLDDGAIVPTWTDSIGGRAAMATGSPTWSEQALGMRSAVRFHPSDGADFFVVPPELNPLAGSSAFSVTVAFASVGSPEGGQGPWYGNTGLVDANAASFTRDWGLSINASGQLSAGIGDGVLGQGSTAYAPIGGLADGSFQVATFTWGDNTLSLYTNGAPPTTVANVDGQPRDSLAVYLGALTNGARPFDGFITEMRLYDDALTAAEVATVHRSIRAPLATNDVYFVSPGRSLEVGSEAGVLQNDRPYPDDPMEAELVAMPRRGTLQLQPDGSFTYVPNAEFTSGTDTFTYRARSGEAASLPAEVHLVINSADDQRRVTINELHVNPDIETELVEFIELHNPGDVPVNLAGWRIAGGIRFELPANARVEAGGYYTIAQNPAALAAKFGVSAAGPYEGQLSNEGELVELRTPDGTRVDQVDYGTGFPWPTVGDAPGYSMELLNPGLDNDLAGSWRSSVGQQELITAGDTWRLFKGIGEPSGGDATWRYVAFDDTAWSSGSSPFGFSNRVVTGTTLDDMRNGYTSFYLRKTFQIEDPSSLERLDLRALYDDGFNLWINGVHLLSANVPGENLPFDAIADSSRSTTRYEDFSLPDPASYLVAGENVIAVHVVNASLSNSDAFFDAVLIDPSRPAPGPTPGGPNSMRSATAPPQLRQVNHAPQQPKSGEDVTITIKATDPDGVARVSLEYQIVAPGNYVRRTDSAFAQWQTIPMRDDGLGGDASADDDIYTAVLGANLQQHRHLVRYRVRAVDALGEEVLVPYADDPQPNFAYFVYDGVPEWTAANRPGVSDPVTFNTEVMTQLPVYHLIANEDDVTRSQYVSSAREQQFYGTMVYDGVVYDHIQFGIRGEFSTYVSGKNKWKFYFNRGHEFQARDNYGNLYPSTWRTMNFSPAATPWVEMNRGMAGIDEAIAYRLFDLAGNPSPATNFLQFRVIDDQEESTPDQYRGDLWGLYLTLEHPDGRFLDARDLPDGTTYKVENAQGDIKHQAAVQPDATRDFRDMMASANRTNTESWWRENIDLDVYFTFRAINRAINNMDLRDGWNHYLYFNSETGQWETIPWDLDMLWVPTTHWSGVIRYQNALRHDALAIEYANRARELQDLLFSPDQVAQLVDEFAGFVNPPARELTMADVDQFMWNYHPRASTSGDDIHRGAFNKLAADYDRFQGPNGVRRIVSADHEGMAQWIEDFLLPAPGGGSTPAGYGANQLDRHAIDPAIPHQPRITYAGAANYPVDQLVFRTSPFSDPDADSRFAALEWRIAEVNDVTAPSYDPAAPPKYEIESIWESGEQTEFLEEVAIPVSAVQPGHAYRVRVRMKDDTGRYSHWSEPIQFIASPGTPTELIQGLRITEVHYHPSAASPAELAAGFADENEFEFIELANVGAVPLNLAGVALTTTTLPDGSSSGVTFAFADSEIPVLAPGQRLLVVENVAAFRARYGDDLPVAGQWQGRLGNRSETLTLAAAGIVIQQFAYSDAWHPTTDGEGPSLEIVDASAADLNQWNQGTAWRPSDRPGGTPGTSAPVRVPGDVNGDGVFNSRDLVLVFQTGEYEDGIVGNSTFEDGDWNGDGEFDSRDFVYAFTIGSYTALATAPTLAEGAIPRRARS